MLLSQSLLKREARYLLSVVFLIQTVEMESPSVYCLFIFWLAVSVSASTIPSTNVFLDKFNDSACTWLVIWELGVVIQLPPWVFAAYPSSLFLHFNIDVHGEYI